jgi:hypothetical protein
MIQHIRKYCGAWTRGQHGNYNYGWRECLGIFPRKWLPFLSAFYKRLAAKVEVKQLEKLIAGGSVIITLTR